MRRILGVLGAVLALGGAALGARGLEGRRLGQARAAAQAEAVAAQQRAADALSFTVRGLEGRATVAAGVPQLIRALGVLSGNAIGEARGTLTDVFRDEAYWKPFREEFPISAVSVEGTGLQVAVGVEPEGFAAGALVGQARDRGLASALLVSQGQAYAAAASGVTVPGLTTPVILVLARPLDDLLLGEAAARARGAVLLSDGRAPLARGGAAAEVARLTALVGRESGPPPADPAGTWAAAAGAVTPGLWLWTYAAAPAGGGASVGPGGAGILVWGVGVVLAALALVLGLRRGPARVAVEAVAPAPAVPVDPAEGARGAQALHVVPTPAAPRTQAPPQVTAHAAMAAPPVRPTGGHTFGRYLLLERLGEGGMSQVYAAVTFGAEGFRRRFVVKRLRPELATDPSLVAQFTDEAILASSLVHSNIVPVFDFGRVGDEYFLATEYILGRDLGRVVRRLQEVERRALPTPLALHAGFETLKALEYAHTKLGERGQPLGIVHRDVSPSNILVSARGEVKLFDFGIVKAEGRVTRTQHGVVKGNVSFMSPEQARGGETDARADLFSLGLVLYYCLTGEVLYQGRATYELLLKAASGPGADERARLTTLEPRVAQVLMRSLEIDPGLRYQSAGEFAAALAPLVDGPGGELAALVQRLFGGEFRDEERRFARAIPPGPGPGPGPADRTPLPGPVRS